MIKLNLNTVIISGTLTADPALGKAKTLVCHFNIANNQTFKTENGEEKTNTTFVECQVWSKSAENFVKFAKKGSHLMIEGELRQVQGCSPRMGEHPGSPILVVGTPVSAPERVDIIGQGDTELGAILNAIKAASGTQFQLKETLDGLLEALLLTGRA